MTVTNVGPGGELAIPSPPEKANNVDAPAHYTGAKCYVAREDYDESMELATLECINVIEALDLHMHGHLQNCFKYLWRAGKKQNDPLEDLKKARYYLDRQIKLISPPWDEGCVQ